MIDTTGNLVKTGVLKVGSRVEIFDSFWSVIRDVAIGKGVIATVRVIKHELGVGSRSYVGLEFKHKLSSSFHSCQGITEDGYGYFIAYDDEVRVMRVNKEGW